MSDPALNVVHVSAAGSRDLRGSRDTNIAFNYLDGQRLLGVRADA